MINNKQFSFWIGFVFILPFITDGVYGLCTCWENVGKETQTYSSPKVIGMGNPDVFK